MREPIKIPNFNRIIEECCLILVQNSNFKENSWTEMDNDRFWINKLKEELREVEKCIINDMDAKYTKKEIADLINVACMLYTSMDAE